MRALESTSPSHQEGKNVVPDQVVPQACRSEVGFTRQLRLFRLTRKSGRPVKQIIIVINVFLKLSLNTSQGEHGEDD